LTPNDTDAEIGSIYTFRIKGPTQMASCYGERIKTPLKSSHHGGRLKLRKEKGDFLCFGLLRQSKEIVYSASLRKWSNN